ncbi:hypothetical protein Vafri_3217 [Volvox africanus]|uniref:Uncharacterized protein n=1 Tax=Volvox africanus TaxID=51714 RepID=A0A8J4AR25_9CHLO|nr:hypothetical protein Vafri_3217 [Volvox africanus]
MSTYHSAIFLILMSCLACAAVVRPYPRLSTQQSPGLHADAQHHGMGFLGYGFAIHAQQIAGPWSWLPRWAFCALRELVSPLRCLPAGSCGFAAAAQHPHAALTESGRRGGEGAGAAPESLVRGGDDSGITATFGELYGYDEGSGGAGGPVGACYDIFTDDLARERTGAPGASEHDMVRHGSSPSGGGGRGNRLLDSTEGRAAAGLLQAGAPTFAAAAPRKPLSRPAVIYLPPLTGTELQAKLDNKYVDKRTGNTWTYRQYMTAPPESFLLVTDRGSVQQQLRVAAAFRPLLPPEREAYYCAAGAHGPCRLVPDSPPSMTGTRPGRVHASSSPRMHLPGARTACISVHIGNRQMASPLHSFPPSPSPSLSLPPRTSLPVPPSPYLPPHVPPSPYLPPHVPPSPYLPPHVPPSPHLPPHVPPSPYLPPHVPPSPYLPPHVPPGAEVKLQPQP